MKKQVPPATGRPLLFGLPLVEDVRTFLFVAGAVAKGNHLETSPFIESASGLIALESVETNSNWIFGFCKTVSGSGKPEYHSLALSIIRLIISTAVNERALKRRDSINIL